MNNKKNKAPEGSEEELKLRIYATGIRSGEYITSSSDKKNSQVVFDIFKELSQEFKQTLLIVTHDNEFAQSTDRIIQMEDGRIIRM